MRKGLLLGAGFSRDIGMPLVGDVTGVFLGTFSPVRAKALAAQMAKNEPYTKDRPINRAAIDRGMQMLLDYKNATGRNYEELLAQLEGASTSSQSDRDSFHYLFGIFYNLVYSILRSYQRESYEILYRPNRSCFLLDNLLSDTETWCFTLNHDVYLECLAVDLGIPVTYGDTGNLEFPISNRNLADKLELTCSKREDLRIDNPGWIVGAKGINLLRLHGGFSEFEYKDGSLICNPPLFGRRSSIQVMADFERIESMGFYHNGARVPSGRDRVVTGPDGTLDIVRRAVLTGGKKYSQTTNFKKGEEKLKLFADVLQQLDELTIIGYSFGDPHVNHRIGNAMVLNAGLKVRIVDPSRRGPWPEFLRQFDYGDRLRGGQCTAAEWMAYVPQQKWQPDVTKAIKANEGHHAEIRRRVERGFPPA